MIFSKIGNPFGDDASSVLYKIGVDQQL